MDQLKQQVARARRRKLNLEQFLGRLVWCLLAALTLAAIAVAIPRLIAIENVPANWDAIWLAASAGAGFLAAAAWTFISNRTPIDAAIEIDRRFDLRERVASSLSLSDDDQTTPAGRALVSDALRAVHRIDVDEKFRVKVGRRAWWPLLPAAVAFVLVMFVDNRQAASSIDPNSAAKTEQQTKTAIESLRKKIEEERAKHAKDKNLEKVDGLFKQIEKGTRDLEDKQNLDRTKAAVKLNDLAQQLQKQREQLGGSEKLKQQMQNMKNLGAGPAEKAVQAMKEGDFKKALDEIQKLANDLKEGKLSDADKEKLANQLQQLQEKMEAAAEAHKQAQEDIKKQIEQAKRQGDMATAGELQQKLEQLQQQQQQMNQMKKMAQQLGNAKQGLQQGDGKKAAQALAQMAQQLDQMQQEMDQMKMLDMAMNQMEMAKDAMACKACQGKGCAQCQGNQAGMGQGNKLNGKPGMGMGKGKGIGPRPEEKNATNLRDTQVRQNARQGKATFDGLVDGPNIKGDAAQAIKEEMATLGAQPADPLTSERLPSSRKEHAQEYFDTLIGNDK